MCQFRVGRPDDQVERKRNAEGVSEPISREADAGDEEEITLDNPGEGRIGRRVRRVMRKLQSQVFRRKPVRLHRIARVLEIRVARHQLDSLLLSEVEQG